jgi:hypothetical protein
MGRLVPDCTSRSMRVRCCQPAVSSPHRRYGCVLRRKSNIIRGGNPDCGQMGDHGSDDFIEVYDGALDGATCAALIRQFDASGAALRGRAGSGVNTAVKNSWDITITGKPEWADAERALNLAMLEGLKRYLR